MQEFKVEGGGVDKTIEAAHDWQAAGEYAVEQIGFGDDDLCWDGFSFTVNGVEFFAELHQLHGPDRGLVRVTQDQRGWLFDEDGCLEEDIS